jgi:rhamnulokinase
LTDAAPSFAAVDLGAESGRVIVGRFAGDSLELSETHRFANTPVSLPDGLHWNLLSLFSEMLTGLAKASADPGPLAGIGVDTWGVDYGLLDREGRLLGLPYHYRDRRTEGMMELADTRIAAGELYARTGIQRMPINTVYQLLAEADTPAFQSAERIALVPDLLGLWLTGSLANEITIASTTGLLDPATGGWARDVIAGLGLRPELFAGEPTEPGVCLGPTRPELDGLNGAPVWTVPSHDTASAFVAAPVSGPGAAILSSGTWSLLGVESETPVLGPAAAAANLTNERGIDGSTRLLRNVMGLWLVQECRRSWRRAGIVLEYAELEALAGDGDDVALIDPDHPDLLRHGDLPDRIARLCAAGGQSAPREPAEVMRTVLLSLACKYRYVLAQLRSVTRRPIETIHVIGGGSRNRGLCRLTADITGCRVIAGPVEATALGNLLVQARAAGLVASLAEMRALVTASVATETFEPSGDAAASTYERFLAVTGLTHPASEPIHA